MRRQFLTCGIVAAVLAASFVAVSLAAGSATGQRIAIEGRGQIATGKTTWKLIPLAQGGLARDAGTAVSNGNPGPLRIGRDGQAVTTITGGDVLMGKLGSITLTERVSSRNAGFGHTADIGTWKFVGKSGAYAGYSGGGGFAATLLPNGTLLFRMEGYVKK